MTNLCNITQTPDWNQFRVMVPEVAGKRLTVILAGLDRTEKQVYAMRGMAMLLIEERELYRWVIDDEVGDYFQSFDRYLKQTCPESWSYCRQALNAVKELKDLQFEDLLSIRRCNIEQLKKVSSNIRILPEVVAAAKSLPEKSFVAKMNQEHDQHLETKTPIVMAPTDEVEEFETALALATLVEGCTTRAEAIRAVSVSYIQDHQGQVEQSA